MPRNKEAPKGISGASVVNDSEWQTLTRKVIKDLEPSVFQLFTGVTECKFPALKFLKPITFCLPK